MAEDRIESVEPLLTPPVVRQPTGISDADEGDVVSSFMCCAYDEGDDD